MPSFLYNNGGVQLIDASKQIYIVTNERNEVNMVKYSINKCTCFATKNCAHFLACMLFKGQNIFENHLQKNNALAKSLTKLKMNQKGNQSSGRKYRDNIPQFEPTMLCCVCKTEQRKGYPGKFCCDKFVHNKCKKSHRC